MTEPHPGTRRRRVLIALLAAWIAALAGLAWWSVRNDPPTVPEQRTIADALPVLQRAAGALIAASAGDDRAVELGGLRMYRDCSVTPIRRGIEAARTVTVHVPAGRALPVLKEIAAALPAAFRAEAGSSSGGRRVGLHADAGGFVAIDAAADSGTQVFQLEATTGCRPVDGGVDLNPADPPAPSTPPSLRRALTALGSAGRPRLREVACPDGGTARTYTVDGVPAPRDLGRSLQPAIDGATVVRAEPAGWAYLTGSVSVVVVKDGDALRVSSTIACGQ
ncbi:MAG TPA: hypothetical protein VFR35_08530 [Actinoplanes sp.]|nr:hypothetical protein [Actinoplanes sp.]